MTSLFGADRGQAGGPFGHLVEVLAIAGARLSQAARLAEALGWS
jgi:hypothetical protein